MSGWQAWTRNLWHNVGLRDSGGHHNVRGPDKALGKNKQGYYGVQGQNVIDTQGMRAYVRQVKRGQTTGAASSQLLGD